MLAGDPTKFGLEECRMNEEGSVQFPKLFLLGYEIVRKAIQHPDSHSYCPTVGIPKARQAIVEHFNNGQKITPDDVLK